MKMVQGAKAQVEPVVAVDLTGQQAITGLIELQVVGQQCFRKLAQLALFVCANVDGQAIDFLGVVDGQVPALGGLDTVTAAEGHAGQRCLTAAVGAGFLTGSEMYGNAAVIAAQYSAKA